MLISSAARRFYFAAADTLMLFITPPLMPRFLLIAMPLTLYFAVFAIY